jgi:YD repeat-containing protein
MKIKAEHHTVVLASLFTLALIFCAAPARAQLAQLTAIPNGQPAIGEQYTYLALGLFVYSKTDLSLPGPGPIDVTRVYRSRDNTTVSGSQQHNNRAFGLGTRLNYDMFLSYVGLNSNAQYEWDVEMPDSSALACTSTTNSYPFTCNDQPAGEWFNAYIDSNSDLIRQDGMTYHFDSSGLLVSIKDHYNYDNQITITRGTNTSGKCASAPSEYVSEVASSNGRYVCFSYGGGSSNPYDITEIYDNAGIKEVNYSYGSSNQLQTVAQTNFNANAVTTYKYNQSTPSGVPNITEIDVNTECSGNGSWFSCSSPGVVKTFVTYLTAANSAIFLQSISSQIPGNGYQYSYTFDSTNTYVTKVVVTLPDTSTRKFQYDEAGYVTLDKRNPSQSSVSEEDTVFTRGGQKVGNSTEFVNLVIEEDSNGDLWRETQYTYSATTGDVTGVTLTPPPGQSDNNCDPFCAGTPATWSYTYEPAGTGFNRLTSAVEPMAYDGVGTTYAYNDSPTSPSVTITDPLGRVTTITGNAQGQPVSIQDPLGNPPIEITYDGTGNLSSVTDRANNKTSFQPDADGRIIQASSPLGRTTKYAYDALDDVTDVYVDPNGLDLHTNYAYDLVGQVRSITTPKGNTTTITRNAILTQTTVTDPLGNTTVTNLEGQGRKTDFTDQRGLKTTYKYDLYGHVSKTVFNSNTPSGSPPQETVTFNSFDALDRPTSATDSLSGTLSDTYDSLDSILSENDTYTPNNSVTYGYDPNGRRISMQGTLNKTALPTVNYGYDCADELIGITTTGSGYSNPPNCSSSTSVTNGTTSTQVGINYDADGLPNWIESDRVETTFTPRDTDERVTNQAFLVPACSGSNGTLNYTYDDDGLLIGKGGCLAAVNLPPPTTSGVAYDADDQIKTWNGTAASVDAASNITQDPAGGNSLSWTSRNQVHGINSTGNIYDATGRRENAITSSDWLSFLHDGSGVAGWADLDTNNSWNFLEIGGLPLAGSFTASGTTTNWVPLIDATGSTIALFNPATPTSPPATTYTYDPSGTPTISGSSNNYPFLYHGMEHEFVEPNPYYYTGDGAYYSAQIMRSLSLTGAQGTTGPGNGRGPHSAHLGAPAGGNGSFGHWYVNNVLAPMEPGQLNAGDLPDIELVTESGSYFVPLGEIAEIIQEWVSFFQWLFGGSPGLPPNYYLFQRRLTYKRHQLYPGILAILQAIVTQGSDAPAAQGAAPSNKPPLQGETAYPPGIEPVWDSGGPTDPGECQSNLGSLWMFGKIPYDIGAGAVGGFSKGAIGGAIAGGIVSAPAGGEALAPGAMFGGGLGTLFGMWKGVGDFFHDYQDRCEPKVRK